MAINRFTTVRISATFRDSAGAVIDPTVVTLRLREPSGTITVYTYLTDVGLVRDSAGMYHMDYLPMTAGDYAFHWRGTGNCVASEDGSFTVSSSSFAA